MCVKNIKSVTRKTEVEGIVFKAVEGGEME